MAYDYEKFKEEICAMTQIDLNDYKEKQMKRRIDFLIQKWTQGSYEDYMQMLLENEERLEEFVSYLTINVSEFYRNPKQWTILHKEVFPALFGRFGKNLKIWSAACSTGDEPYSLVLALSRHISLSRINVIATDLDKNVLAKAKIGLYNSKSVAAVPEDLRNIYFRKRGSAYQISDEVKSRVEFRQHNLLTDAYIKDCHLIVCRNVLIYFTEEAQDEVWRKFFHSLLPGGSLFIGNAEQVIHYKDIGYERSNPFFYRKPF